MPIPGEVFLLSFFSLFYVPGDWRDGGRTSPVVPAEERREVVALLGLDAEDWDRRRRCVVCCQPIRGQVTAGADAGRFGEEFVRPDHDVSDALVVV